jgi:hypothetical protein
MFLLMCIDADPASKPRINKRSDWGGDVDGCWLDPTWLHKIDGGVQLACTLGGSSSE